MRLIPPLTTLSRISRAGVFVSAIITVGLNARFLTNTSWANNLLIYIVVIASLSALACLVPPYPNFLYDAFWALTGAPETTILRGTSSATRFSGSIIYAAPAFATYILNESPLPPLQVSLLDPTNDSIRFSASSEIKVPRAMTMHLDSMHAEILRPQSDRGTNDDPIPLATVDISKLKFKGNQKISVENQTLQLGDAGQFAKLVEDVAYNPAFRVAMHAKTKIGMAGLRTSVDITKEMKMPGFDNFTEFAISNLTISERDDQGNNIFAETVLFNPTPASVTLGDLTLSILAANHSIGTATTSINNITSGNNTLRIRASLDGEVLEESISEIIREQIPYLRNGNIKMTAAGESVMYGDQHLEYWEKALRAVRIDVTRPVREMVDMVLETFDSGENDGDEGGSGFDLFGIEIDIPGVREGVRTVVESLVEQILDTARRLDEGEEDGFTEGLAVLGALVLRLLEALGVL
ncbi:hypothetical protein BDW71DRAFT_215421 [Aspergillus fruticulosus]